MESTGNKELDAILRRRRIRELLRARQERARKDPAKRWAVARWVVKLEYYADKDTARNRLARLNPTRRVGLVDCDTGDAWTTLANLKSLMPALRRERDVERFRLRGRLGPIRPKIKRKGAKR